MERTTDHLRPRQPEPQSTPSMHQTPLYILMTPEQSSGNILTLPGGRLPRGIRNSTLIVDNASHILKQHNINFSPTAAGWVHDDESREFGQAYLVEPAYHTNVPEHIDLTGSMRGELIPAAPQPEHNSQLELHHYTSLLARMQSMNFRRRQINRIRSDAERLPLREEEEAFLRSFGRYILRRATR